MVNESEPYSNLFSNFTRLFDNELLVKDIIVSFHLSPRMDEYMPEYGYINANPKDGGQWQKQQKQQQQQKNKQETP